MLSTTILVGIAGLLLLSVVISAISYNRQKAIATRKKKFKKHHDNADEMMNFIRLLCNVDENYDLLILLQKQAVAELKSANALMPEDAGVKTSLDSEKTRLENFQQKNRGQEVTPYVASDAELAQAKTQLGQISKLLSIFRNRQDISSAQQADMDKHLKRLSLELEVNSHIHLAESYGEKNDIVMYQLHLKQARERLKKSALDTEEKNARVKELTDIINESKNTNKVAKTNSKTTAQ